MVPVHVLHIIPNLDAGGAERALVHLVTDPDRRDIRHTVLCLQKGGFFAEKVQADNVELIAIGGEGLRALPGWIAAIRREVKRLRPDILQSWMYYANLIVFLALIPDYLLGSKRRPKLIWGIRCSDLDFSKYGKNLKRVVDICARFSRLPDAIIANSHAGLRTHQDLRYNNDLFEVIPNGFDPDLWQIPAETRPEARHQDADRLTALTLARVDTMKDYPTLNAAAAQVSGVTFYAAGLGTDAMPELSNIVGLGRRTDVPDLVQSADILVSSSAYGEGMSNSIGEAMASGIAVVATDVGDARHMLIDNDAYATAGIVVPARDPETLAKAIRTLVDDPDLRTAMGEAGRKRVEGLFSLKACHDAYASLYRRLVA